MGTAGIAAGHPATVDAGMSILDRGGNAADAAVASVLASCVAETIMTGLGGGGFATYYEAATQQVSCLDFFTAMPGIDGYTDTASLQPIEVSFGGMPLEFAIGGASVAVPGVPAGCQALHRRFGRLSWPQVVAPAIGLAHEGVPLPARHAEALRSIAPALLPGDGAMAYAPNGWLLNPGQRLRHPGLTDTLRALSREGAEVVYRGEMARRIVDSVRRAGGRLGPTDLAAYRVTELPVHTAGFAGYEIAGRDDLLHTVDTLRRLDSVLAYDLADRAAAIAGALSTGPDGSLGDTTNISVIDSQGNACVVTTTLGIGSGIWPPGTGIHLNSMRGEGELRAGVDIPGQRLASMMSPLVVREPITGQVRMAVGAAGASRIRTALTHTLVHALADGDDVSRAIARPRFHPVGSTVHCESRLDSKVREALQRRGFQPQVWEHESHYFGGVSAVDAQGAAGDPRRDGTGAVRGLAAIPRPVAPTP